jgi:hypothetical protein
MAQPSSGVYGVAVWALSSAAATDTNMQLFVRDDAGGGGVGVGVSVPNYKLDVAGDCNITGTYRVNGAPFTSGITGVTIQNSANAVVGTRPILNMRSAGGGVTMELTDDPAGNRVFISVGFTSDRRLKENITNLDGGLSVINGLRPVAFEYNGLGSYTAGRRGVSIIAQELAEILPDAVFPIKSKLRPEDEEPSDILAWDPIQIVCHLVLAVKQLSERLNALEGKAN